MARVLCNANVAAALSEGIALLATRRGFSSASAAIGRGSGRARSVEEKMIGGRKEGASVDAGSSSWVPDPKTGYYRPANRSGETDPAELRQILLSNKA